MYGHVTSGRDGGLTPTTIPPAASADGGNGDRPAWTLTPGEQALVRSVALGDPEVRSLLAEGEIASEQVVPWGSERQRLGGVLVLSLGRPIHLPAGTRKLRLDDPTSSDYVVTRAPYGSSNVSELRVLVAFGDRSVVSIEAGPGAHDEGPRERGAPTDH